MHTLSTEQRGLLLDYYFGCASTEQAASAKELIATHDGASQFYLKLEHALSKLDHLHDEQECPQHLITSTIGKVEAHHQETTAGEETLKGLLEAEQKRPVTTRPSFWRNFAGVAAAAAAIVIISGIYVPVTQNMRAKAWTASCGANLQRINQGIARYANDNDNKLPAVTLSAGAPWWKVGAQGSENHSNTRNLWLLVQQGYVEPEQFVCSARTEGRAIQLDRDLAEKYKDFPERRYVTYSFKLICDQNQKAWPTTSTALMADLNPVFEGFDYIDKKSAPVKLSDKLLRANSKNHRGKGQNVMFSDGSVEFVKQRTVGLDNDDIFTVQNVVDAYQGVEVPSCLTDTFLVP